MSTVRNGPLVGLAGQVLLLEILARAAGLGTAAWLAGLAYGGTLCALLSRGLNRSAGTGADLGPADRVTLTRATLVGGVLALTVESLSRPVPVPVLVGLAAVALALDWVDGRVARRTGTVSGLGARFDMEVDAFLILVLSAYAAGRVGGWVLAIGLMRYANGAAEWVLPWLHGPVSPRYWRKVVAAVQGVMLAVAAAGLLPGPVVSVALGVALALLAESFGRDVWELWRRRGPVPGGALRRGRHAHPALR
ncbi:MAG TPA: CDP-alcohol phosphatidyltransferase family protein [Mycobacteriales bacterium]|nr:CDP-alcohol phosphatidyltransferase family protein [Mycobacteriales bacterium]